MIASKMRKEKNKLLTTTKKVAATKAEVRGAAVASAKQILAEDPEETKIRKAIEIMNQVYEKTNKHYRRYFEDELEHNEEIFSKNVFTNIDIKRGQSRGVEKSWFSFGGGQQDESGQESTIRTIGTFKGTIEIFNTERKARFEAEKK